MRDWWPNADASATGDGMCCCVRRGLVENRKRTQRLYREERLTVRKRRGRMLSHEVV